MLPRPDLSSPHGLLSTSTSSTLSSQDSPPLSTSTSSIANHRDPDPDSLSLTIDEKEDAFLDDSSIGKAPLATGLPKVSSTVKTTQSGIWTVYEHIPAWSESVPGLSVLRDLAGFQSCIPYVRRLLQDLWKLGPALCMAYILAQVLSRVMPTMRLAQSSAFLKMIETAVTTKQVDRQALTIAILLQFIFGVVEWAIRETIRWSTPILQRRFKYHVNQKLMQVQLRLDLPTSQNPDVKSKLAAAGHARGGGKAWEAFEKLVGFGGLVIELISTAGFVVGTMLHQPGGRTIVALCLLSPIANGFGAREWIKAYFAEVTSVPYLRMDALYAFTHDGRMKQDMLGHVMGDYVLREYQNALKELGDVDDGYPRAAPQKSWSMFALGRELASDSALVLLGIKMVFNPQAIPLVSIAVLEQTSVALSNTMQRLFFGGGSILEAFNGVKALYEIADIENDLVDGTEPYPIAGSVAKGMEVEFKNVSFTYPRTGIPVIKDLSFKITAGSLCVVVGENGSGKSSTLKLLNRMYDVDGGDILIDGKPIRDYRMNDLRSASAIMHQGYRHFEFSLRENIGFGNVSRMDDLEAIKKAAGLGGASEFIEELPESYDTKRNVDWDYTVTNGKIPEGCALNLMIRGKNESPRAFSGGQTQRLALSRTFMRSTTCDVKFLAYDEPSAALDPQAEFALFERLRNLRDGKTMLFITHRFGYLTKYADLVVYMEKGKAVEQGTHEELLALNGKYAHLYNVQAQAFA